MADGTPWKHDLSHDSTISLWVPGAMMKMAGLPFFVCFLFKNPATHTQGRPIVLNIRGSTPHTCTNVAPVS